MAFIESGKKFDTEENREKMKQRMENMTNVQYTLRVPKALHTKVKMKLLKEDKNFRALLIDMLELYVKE